MRCNKRIISAALAAAMAIGLAGCSAPAGDGFAQETPAPTPTPDASQSIEVPAETDDVTLLDEADLFTERDLDPNYDTYTAIVQFREEGITAEGKGVVIKDNTVTILEGGIYLLAGGLSQGQILVDTVKKDKVQLVLLGLELTNPNGAALYLKKAEKVFLTLRGGCHSTLRSSGTFEPQDENNVDGAIFSKCDLTINGHGELDVISTGHGIVAKDHLKLVDGTVNVTAAGSGIQANDSIRLRGGSYTITAETDGLHCAHDDADKGFIWVGGGELTINAGSDGLEASGLLQVSGGTITVSAGDDGLHSDSTLAIAGGSIAVADCYEGLEGSDVVISGGDIHVASRDDGINAGGGSDSNTDAPHSWRGDTNHSILISGGTITVETDGDGLDSNGTLTVTGGEVLVYGPAASMNGAIDYETDGSISGGTVIALDCGSMSGSFNSGTQPSLAVAFAGNAGVPFTVTDSRGNLLAQCTPTLDYRVAVVSCPGMTVGETITLTAGENTAAVELTETHTGNVGGFGGHGGQPRPPQGSEQPPQGFERPERGDFPGDAPEHGERDTAPSYPGRPAYREPQFPISVETQAPSA